MRFPVGLRRHLRRVRRCLRRGLCFLLQLNRFLLLWYIMVAKVRSPVKLVFSFSIFWTNRFLLPGAKAGRLFATGSKSGTWTENKRHVSARGPGGWEPPDPPGDAQHCPFNNLSDEKPCPRSDHVTLAAADDYCHFAKRVRAAVLIVPNVGPHRAGSSWAASCFGRRSTS